MKSYTDISQSKKLTEILPHNTAYDFYYRGLILKVLAIKVTEENNHYK